MATYSKRADGRYATTISTGQYRDNGSLISRTIYGKTIRELDEKVRSIQYQISQGIKVFDDKVTFGDYAETWYKVHKATKGIQTREMYRGILDRHINLLEGLPLRSVTATHIQQQINAVAGTPRTAEITLLTCSQIMQSAIRDRYITFNPCEGINLPRKIGKEKRAFTEAEKKAIREADYTEEERAYIMLLYCCGLRPAEAWALTWSDINFKNETITVCKSLNFEGQKPVLAPPKTNNGIRVIEMHRSLIEPLKDYRRINKQLLLFGTPEGQYRTKSNYQTLYRHCHAKIEAALGYKTDITAYYFRHNFCTSLYYSGVSIKEAVRLMGHNDSAMIMKVYAHLDSAKENTRSKLNAINF